MGEARVGELDLAVAEGWDRRRTQGCVASDSRGSRTRPVDIERATAVARGPGDHR
jgi:hypothetical protein